MNSHTDQPIDENQRNISSSFSNGMENGFNFHVIYAVNDHKICHVCNEITAAPWNKAEEETHVQLFSLWFFLYFPKVRIELVILHCKLAWNRNVLWINPQIIVHGEWVGNDDDV